MVAPAGELSVFPTPDTYEFFTRSAARHAPNWLNETSFESVARAAEYKPAAFIDLVAPKPLLLIGAIDDSIIPISQIRSAFARAGEPKKLIELPCGHFEVFPGGTHHDEAADAATEWFTTHSA